MHLFVSVSVYERTQVRSNMTTRNELIKFAFTTTIRQLPVRYYFVWIISCLYTIHLLICNLVVFMFQYFSVQYETCSSCAKLAIIDAYVLAYITARGIKFLNPIVHAIHTTQVVKLKKKLFLNPIY